MDRKLFQLNGEQMAILHQIREKLREFERAGGLLVWDYEAGDVLALNTENTIELGCWWSGERPTDEGYIEATEYLQDVPFSICGLWSEDGVFVKMKNVNKNLF